MQYYDVKKLTVKIKDSGTATVNFSHPSLGFKRPQSEFEAQKMCTEFSVKIHAKKYKDACFSPLTRQPKQRQYNNHHFGEFLSLFVS